MDEPKVPTPGISFSDGLAVAAIVLTIVLVVLDKAGKLRGPTLFCLLALAAVMTIPLVLGNSWVSASPNGTAKMFRVMLLMCMVGVGYAALSAWIATGSEFGQDHSADRSGRSKEENPQGAEHPQESIGTKGRESRSSVPSVPTPKPSLAAKDKPIISSAPGSMPDYSDGVEFQISVFPGDYEEGTDVGGIKWEKNFSDARLTIKNKLIVAIEKIDFWIRFDINIAGMAQFGTQVPEVSTAAADSAIGLPILGGGRDASGKEREYPIVPVGPISAPVYHVICPRLSAKGQVQLIAATIAYNPPTGTGATFSLPEKLLADKRPPKVIQVTGTYETGIVDGAHRFPIQYDARIKLAATP